MDTSVDIELATALFALHLLAWAVWIGGVYTVQALGARVRARGDAAATVGFVADVGALGLTALLPAAVAVLVTGGWLASDLGYTFADDWWVPASASLWLVAVLGSTAVRVRHAQRVVRGAAEHGVEDEDVQWRARRIFLLARGELLACAVALVLIVLRPS